MSEETNIKPGPGLKYAGLLSLVFVVAKLWGKIDWHWAWVVSPVWISLSLGIVFHALAAVLNRRGKK